MSDTAHAFPGSTLHRWASQCVLAFVLLIAAVGIAVKVAMGFGSADDFAVFRSGLAFTALLWLGSLLVTLSLTRTSDAFLYFLTPLTPQRYYWRNFIRIALMTLTVYIAIPGVLLTFGLVAMTFGSPSLAHLSHHLLLNATLLYYVALAATLCEAMAGKRWATSPVFVLRHVIRWLGWRLIPIGFALGLTVKWWRPAVQPIVQRAVEALANGGALGHFVLLLLSPMSGVLAAAHSPDPSLSSWLTTAFLLGMLAVSIRVITKTVGRPMLAVDHDYFQNWLEHRIELEDAEQALEDWNQNSLWQTAQPEAPADLPGAYDTGPIESIVLLPYEDNLSPEAHVIRYKHHWRCPGLRDATRLSRAFAFLKAHLWQATALFGWALWLTTAHIAVMDWAVPAAVLFIAFCACGLEALRLRDCMATGAGLPLRWPRLIWADHRTALRRYAWADLVAAVLVARLIGFGPGNAIALFAFLQVMRLYWYTTMWLTSLRSAGRRWLPLIHVIIFAVAAITGLLALAFGVEFQTQGPSAAPFPAALILLAIACALFILSLLFLAVALRRCGTNALGWPKKPPRFLQEPL